MNTTALVPVFTGTLNQQSAQLVNARELHAFLEVGRNYNAWIKERIETYGFIEKVDFLSVYAGIQNGIAGNRGKRIDYHISLDMAKELAMVERNEKGKQARRYFIECERKMHENKVPSLMARRWMISFDHANREQLIPLKDTDVILSWADIPKIIRAHDNGLSAAELAEIGHACFERIEKNAKGLKEYNTQLLNILVEKFKTVPSKSRKVAKVAPQS